MAAAEPLDDGDARVDAFWRRLARAPAPSKVLLTVELLREIVGTIARTGTHPETAARAAGVPADRWDRWRAHGRRDLAREEDTLYAQLERAVTMAFAHAESEDILRIAQDPAWQSAAWIRERVEPHKYGQRREVNVTHRALPMIDTDRGTVEQLEQLYELLRVFSPDPSTPGLNKERRPVLELLPADVVEDSLEAPAPKSESPGP